MGRNPWINRFFRRNQFLQILLLFAFNAFARSENPIVHPIQDEAESEIYELPIEELAQVEVTIASFFQQDELSAGSQVNVIKESDWRQNGARRFFDIFQFIPGLRVYPYLGGTPAIVIRGYASRTSQRGLGLFLDGIPLNGFDFSTGLLDKANVDLGLLTKTEVLSGPGSTLYGSDSYHGAIGLTSWSGSENKTEIEGGLGNFGFFKVNAKTSHSTFLNLRYSLLAGFSHIGDQNVPFSVTSGTGTVSGTEERKFQTFTTIFKLHDQKKFELNLYYNNVNSSGWPGASPFYLFNIQSGLPSSTFLSKLEKTWDLGKSFELLSKGYFWTGNFKLRGVQETTDATFLIPDADEERVGLWLILKRPSDKKWPIQAALGYNLDWFHIGQSFSVFPPGIVPGVSGTIPSATTGSSRSINALFLQTDTNLITDKLHLLLGARYDVYSDGFNPFSPRAGIVFNPTQSSAFKLLYNESFRAPSAAELRPSVVPIPLEPETLDTIETIYLQRNKTFDLKSGVFYNRWTNGILLTPSTSTNPVQYSNAEKNEAYGAYLDFKLLTSLFNGLVGGSYIRSANISSDRIEYTAFPMVIFNWGLEWKLKSEVLSVSLMNHHEWNRTAGTEPTSPKLDPYFRTDLGIQWDYGPLLKKKKENFIARLNFINLFNLVNYSPSLLNFPGGFREPGISVTFSTQIQL